MRSYCQYFKIDTMPILTPDSDMGLSKQDLDAEGSGRDELGFMHRIVLRERVSSWKLNYSKLTEEEFEYMNKLFEGKPEFSVEITVGSKTTETKAYCSSISASIDNIKKGTYKGVSFSIIEG